MDGLPGAFQVMFAMPRQRTLKSAIFCRGIGLHSGRRITLGLHPAPVGHGLVFRRTDLALDIPARFDRVGDTRLCTALVAGGARIGTVEHVLAAFAGLGIDNALVTVDGPEIPIGDGSADDFVFLLDSAGIIEQDAVRGAIEILETVRVSDGPAWAELAPGELFGQPVLEMEAVIDFPAPAIGRQGLSLVLSPESFRAELARARTFALASEIAALHEAGLARGGSLENAVVVDGARVLNPSGLRMADEFVRHKLLDAVGDLALAGAPLIGRFRAERAGHRLHNLLLRALFSRPEARRTVVAEPVAGGRALLAAAAA